MIDDVAIWQDLLTERCAGLREAAVACDAQNVGAVARLRRDWPQTLVAAALTLAAARRTAVDKFPDRPEIVADPEGVEQATSALVADHKAARFAEAGVTRVIDLCCGIGGDAMSLAGVAEVTGIDRSPLRAWMTATNAMCRTETADVETTDVGDAAFHFDPGRRHEGRRAWTLEDYRPGRAFLEGLLRRTPDGGTKLGPGVDLDELPGAGAAEIELIGAHGRLVQAVLWTGRLARHPGQRTATRLPEGVQMHGVPAPLPAAASDRFGGTLLVPDPAVERAGLAGVLAAELGLAAPCPALGLLSAEAPVDSPWLTAFEVLEQMPLRRDRLKAWLDEHDAGVVEVKVRGRAADPDELQPALRGAGTERYTVFAVRFGERRVAVVTRRISD